MSCFHSVHGPCAFWAMMKALDQAFMARHGLAHSQVEDFQWGERFFAALDQDHPHWSHRDQEVYMTASCMLNAMACPDTHSWTWRSIPVNPDAFVRAVVLVLENGTGPYAA